MNKNHEQQQSLIVYKYRCLREFTSIPPYLVIPTRGLCKKWRGKDFHDCCLRCHDECVRFHLTHGGAHIDQLDEATSVFPALYLATWYEDLEAVHFLLEKGANVNYADDHGRTALYLAILGRDAQKGFEIASLLIANGANVNARRQSLDARPTLLHEAAQRGELTMVQLLLAHGADSEATLCLNDDITPLKYLDYCDPFDMSIELLLRNRERTMFGRRSYAAYLDKALALVALRFPTYVVLWILDWLPEFTHKPEVRKIRLLERVWGAAARSLNSSRKRNERD